MLAKHALNPIEKKLKGIYSASKERQEKEISTSNLVQMLIQEATNSVNLVSGQCINESSTLTSPLGKDVPWLGSMALNGIYEQPFRRGFCLVFLAYNTSHQTLPIILLVATITLRLPHEPDTCFCKTSNSLSRSIKIPFHRSCSAIIAFLAVSSLSCSSFSI